METKYFYVSSENKGSWSYHIILRILQHAFPSYKILDWDVSSSKHRPLKPHLLVRATHGHLEGQKFPDTDRIPYFMFSGESFNGGPRSYPPLWKFHTVFHANEEHYWFPYFLFHPMVDSPLGVQRRGPPILERPFFLVYIASNPCHHRNHFFELCLKRHANGCHGRGDCYNNYAKIGGSWSNVADALTEYTFALVMENKMESGYITEKILNAYLGGSIPIYYGGGSFTKNIFHSDSFINVSDYPSFESCVDHIVDLYTNQRHVLDKMQKAPIFKSADIENDFYSIFHPPSSTSSTTLSRRYRSVVDSLRHTFPSFV